MRRLIKWLFLLIVGTIALVVGLVLSKDAILKAAVEQQIRAQTGMDVKIGSFSLGLLSPVATLQNLRLYNTAEFGGVPFLDIRELHVEYDRAALAQRKLRITLLRLDLAEFTVARNDAGRTNLFSFSDQPNPKQKSGDALEFIGVDVANLSVGRVQFIDLKNPRNNRALNVNLQNQVFHNIKSPGDLNGVLLTLWLRSGGGFSAMNLPGVPTHGASKAR